MFSEILKKERISKGYTCKEMAEFLNISVRTYQRYESGDRQPNLDILVSIANILDISIDYLLGRNSP